MSIATWKNAAKAPDFSPPPVSARIGCKPGYVNSLLLKMAIEIVDFPIKNGDFP